jgi:hypothetical protein
VFFWIFFSLIATKISLQLSSTAANADIEEVLQGLENFIPVKCETRNVRLERKEGRRKRLEKRRIVCDRQRQKK